MALFFVKGAAGGTVRMAELYRGAVPFVALQLVGLVMVMYWPEIALWLQRR
jgi:TRAP-type mannitol/chloroaromatic compound transport system permease large subunit